MPSEPTVLEKQAAGLELDALARTDEAISHLLRAAERALLGEERWHARNAGHHYERYGDLFHIHGTDAKSGLDHAEKVSAWRGNQDWIRFGQVSQQ